MCYLLRRSVHTEFYIFHAKGLFMSKVKSWCRANAMLVISLLAAVVTAFFVPPDRDYLGYYDLKTLACLFCVLAVVGALRDLHIFSALSQRMVHTFSTVRGVCTALVVITMFGSMLLTNDTALLTFLPLGWFVLSSTGQEKHTALLFILQNCAANLCGMITPFGNPQNLYLFSYYGLSTKTFFSAMLPPFILSAVLILLCCLVFPKEQLSVPEAQVTVDSCRAVIYGGLFCLAVVGHLRRVLHLFRQPCSNGSCPHTVRSPFVPRDHAGLRAYLPDHQQCSCCYSAQPLHAGCPCSSGWRQCGRCRDAGGFPGKPHYLSGIYSPCS